MGADMRSHSLVAYETMNLLEQLLLATVFCERVHRFLVLAKLRYATHLQELVQLQR
jgi:hypothetical protein